MLVIAGDKLQIALFTTAGGGFHGGMSGSAGIELATSYNNDVYDLEGTSFELGGTVKALFGVGLSSNFARGALPVGAMSFGKGDGVDVHMYMNQTKIYNVKTYRYRF